MGVQDVRLGRAVDGTAITRIEQGQRALQLDEAMAMTMAKALNMSLQGMLSEKVRAELERARAVTCAD